MAARLMPVAGDTCGMPAHAASFSRAGTVTRTRSKK